MTHRNTLTCLAAALMLGAGGLLFAANREAPQDASQAQSQADPDQAADKDSATGDSALQAGSRASGKSSAQGGSKEMDQKFVKHFADIGMFEVESARLAQQTAQDQKVKDLARHILNDHQKANDELKQLAQSKGMELPQELMPVSKAKLEALKKKQGEEFDHAYTYQNVAGHVMALLIFRDASEKAQDTELRDWAKSQIAPLQQHLTHAAEIARWDEVDPRGQGGAATAGSRQRGSGQSEQQRQDSSGRQGSQDQDRPGSTTREPGTGTGTGQPGVGGDSQTPSGGSTNERLPGTDDGNRPASESGTSR